MANPVMRMDARTNAKRHPDYLPGCDFCTSMLMVLLPLYCVKSSTRETGRGSPDFLVKQVRPL